MITTVLLNFVRKNWKLVLVLAVILGGYTYWSYLTARIDSLKEKVAAVEKERDGWKTSYDNIKTAVDAQSEQLKQLAKTAEDTNKAFNKLQVSITGQVGSIGSRLDEIQNRDMRNMTPTQAIDHLRDQAIKGQKR